MNWFHAFTLVFVALKIAKLVNWSWWLVFAPSIVSVGFALTLLACVGAVAIIAAKKGLND